MSEKKKEKHIQSGKKKKKVKHLAAKPLNVDSAIERYKNWGRVGEELPPQK